jgi:hypothetical protein
MPSLKRVAKGLLNRWLPGGVPAGGRQAPAGSKPKKVWRMAPGATRGEWVDADAPTTTSPPDSLRSGESSGGWLTSSMDLLSGAEITEGHDTAPAPLAEEKTLPLGTRLRKN